MEFKGTKGKWYHDKETLSIWHPENIGQRIISVDSAYLGATEEQLANALLISKAPEMLEMLENINEYLLADGSLKVHSYQEEVEKLIKQATEL